jgi:hypothetical protein
MRRLASPRSVSGLGTSRQTPLRAVRSAHCVLLVRVHRQVPNTLLAERSQLPRAGWIRNKETLLHKVIPNPCNVVLPRRAFSAGPGFTHDLRGKANTAAQCFVQIVSVHYEGRSYSATPLGDELKQRKAQLVLRRKPEPFRKRSTAQPVVLDFLHSRHCTARSSVFRVPHTAEAACGGVWDGVSDVGRQ